MRRLLPIVISFPAVQNALAVPLDKLMAIDSAWEGFEEEGYAKTNIKTIPFR